MWLLEDEYCQFLPTAAFLGCKKSLWSDKKLTQYKLWSLLDTFDLVLRVVVTAASVPEREAIAQVLSFGLPDGAKVSRLFTIRRLA